MTLTFHPKTLLLCILLQTLTSSARRHRHSEMNVVTETEIDRLLKEEDMETLAMQHAQRVADAGSCDLPKLQVVHVSDHYPGKYYLPHCTLLHRCGKHAGCCGTDRLRCVSAEREKVNLYFYSVRVVGKGMPMERSVEKLVFTNHTKCGCVPNEYPSKHDL